MDEDKHQEFETVDIAALTDEELDDVVGGALPTK
jgi:hypothetical protein